VQAINLQGIKKMGVYDNIFLNGMTYSDALSIFQHPRAAGVSISLKNRRKRKMCTPAV